MGAQVRELTDAMAMARGSESRADWSAELEGSPVYLVHRSFSWLIVVGSGAFLILVRRAHAEGLCWIEKLVAFLVGGLLVMGVVLSHVGVLPVVQVLHVAAAAVLVAALFFWLLATRPQAA